MNHIVVNGITIEFPLDMCLTIQGLRVRLTHLPIVIDDNHKEAVPVVDDTPRPVHRAAQPAPRIETPAAHPSTKPAGYENKARKIERYLRRRAGMGYRRGITFAVYGKSAQLDERGKGIDSYNNKRDLDGVLSKMKDEKRIEEHQYGKGHSIWCLPGIDIPQPETTNEHDPNTKPDHRTEGIRDQLAGGPN